MAANLIANLIIGTSLAECMTENYMYLMVGAQKTKINLIYRLPYVPNKYCFLLIHMVDHI